MPFVVDAGSFELDYPEDIARVEAALSAIARGEWPEAHRRGGRFAV
jgi:hypothetical protein